MTLAAPIFCRIKGVLSLGHPHPNPLPEGEGVGGAGGVDVGGPPWRRQDVTKREMVLMAFTDLPLPLSQHGV